MIAPKAAAHRPRGPAGLRRARLPLPLHPGLLGVANKKEITTLLLILIIIDTKERLGVAGAREDESRGENRRGVAE